MNERGMTLVELLIVIAIITVIAAIAIPNLMRSRMAANEVEAIASVKAICGAQETYHRTDWNKDGIFEYAKHLNDLLETSPGAGDLQLIDRSIASAVTLDMAPTTTPKNGYLFRINWEEKLQDGSIRSYLKPPPNGPLVFGHAVAAIPSEYDISGRSCFQAAQSYEILRSDTGTNAIINQFDRNFGPTAWQSVQ